MKIPRTLLVVGVLGVLAGCGVASPSPSPTASTEPTSEPATPDPVVTTIVLTGTGLAFENSDAQEVDSVAYADGSAAVVAALRDVLTSQPVETPAPAVDEECGWPYASTRWGEPFAGLEVRDQQPPRLAGLGSWVWTAVAEVDGVAIRTEGGVQVGDPAEPLIAALTPEQRETYQEAGLHGGHTPSWLEAGVGSVAVNDVDQPYGVMVATLVEDDHSVVVLSAPRTAFSISC